MYETITKNNDLLKEIVIIGTNRKVIEVTATYQKLKAKTMKATTACTSALGLPRSVHIVNFKFEKL